MLGKNMNPLIYYTPYLTQWFICKFSPKSCMGSQSRPLFTPKTLFDVRCARQNVRYVRENVLFDLPMEGHVLLFTFCLILLVFHWTDGKVALVL